MQSTIVPADSMSAASDPVRHLTLGGAFNFRDVGGYPVADGRRVRWRRLFRSDALHRLSEEDLDLLRAFDIATIIDLRTDRELSEAGQGLLHAEPRVEYIRAPFVPEVSVDLDPTAAEPPDLAHLYADMLGYARPAIAAVFGRLADEKAYPAVVHCAAGKDRTGLTIALVLRALGVSDEDIIADYALTEGFLATYIATLRAAGHGGQFERVHPALLRSEARTMRAALDGLDAEFGETGAFLLACGVDRPVVEALRANLLA